MAQRPNLIAPMTVRQFLATSTPNDVAFDAKGRKMGLPTQCLVRNAKGKLVAGARFPLLDGGCVEMPHDGIVWLGCV